MASEPEWKQCYAECKKCVMGQGWKDPLNSVSLNLRRELCRKPIQKVLLCFSDGFCVKPALYDFRADQVCILHTCFFRQTSHVSWRFQFWTDPLIPFMKGAVPLNRAAVSHRHFAGRNTPRAKQGKIIVLCHRLSENKRETSHTGLMLICHKNNTNISGQGMQGKRWKPLHSHSVHFCLSENPPSPSFTHLKQLHLSAIRQNCG